MTDRFHVSLRKWSALGAGPVMGLECVPDKVGSAFYILAGYSHSPLRQPVRFLSICTCRYGAFLRLKPAGTRGVSAMKVKAGVYFIAAGQANYGAALAQIHASKRYSHNNTSNDGWFWRLHGLR